MARASKKDREEFVAVLVQAFHDRNPIHIAGVARTLMRHAATLGRLAVKDCNVGLTDDELAKENRTQVKIGELCRDELPGVRPKFNGDPRGYVVKLILPTGLYNTWGGAEDGWGVPNS